MIGLFVLAVLAFIVVLALLSSRARPAVYCVTCGTTGSPRRNTRGSILIEIVLWLCFIVPGVIYSLWRLTTVGMVCSACSSDQIIPPSSPRATAERQRLGGPPPLPPR